MTEISFWTTEILFTAIWAVLRAAVWIRQRKINWKREALLLLMYINLAVIIRFTFFPLSRANGRVQPLVFDPAAVFPFRLNLIPFAHLLWHESRWDILVNIIGNVCMFIPSGIVLPVVYKKLNSFPKAVGAGALLSLLIEIIQLPFSARGTDIDDLLLNTIGAAVGFGIYALVRMLIKRKRRI